MTILTWWRVEGRQWSASNSGISRRCKLNFLCSADSQWLEEHILQWQDASPCHCSENTGAVHCGSRWRACYSPCSFQTARKLMLTHGSPRSQRNEVFLRKRKSLMVAHNCALSLLFGASACHAFRSKQKSYLIYSVSHVLWLFISHWLFLSS